MKNLEGDKKWEGGQPEGQEVKSFAKAGND